MKFLHAILGKLPEFQELERAVSGGALPAAVTGLSTVHKASFIASLWVVVTKEARLAPSSLTRQLPSERFVMS